MHFFDNTLVILFVVNLDGYNKLLFEDNRNNRLREDIGLFRSIVNLEIFKRTHFVILLNKFDKFLMEFKIDPISNYFKDYNGDHESLGQVIEFIINKFRDQVRPKNEGKPPSICHFIPINALNTKNVKDMFEFVRNDVIDS